MSSQHRIKITNILFTDGLIDRQKDGRTYRQADVSIDLPQKTFDLLGYDNHPSQLSAGKVSESRKYVILRTDGTPQNVHCVRLISTSAHTSITASGSNILKGFSAQDSCK